MAEPAAEQTAADARQELHAVEHELRAVQEILARMPESDALPADGDEDAWSDDDNSESSVSHNGQSFSPQLIPTS